MKLSAFATLFTLVAATYAHEHKGLRHVQKRQVPTNTLVISASSSTSSSASSVGATTPSAAAPAVSGLASSAPAPAGSGVPPLSAITFGMPTPTTQTVTATYSAGTKPSISGAPPLPTPFVFSAANWPAQDKVPDTSSSQVQQWMQELNGFNIPNLEPTKDGSCVNDTAAANDAQARGWWTCGGWTRPTDITACPDKYTWGVSFDDGPSPYTQTLLNYLTTKDIHATFFVVGSRVIERPQVLIEEYMGGHEISVHTWSHPYLTSLTNEQIVAELGWTRAAIKAILGVTPTTFRPPYGDIDDRVRAIALAMGLVPIIWTRTPSAGQFDTNDWKVAGGLVTGPQSFATFQAILGNATLINTGFIVLEHDLYPQTVDLAIGYTLNAALTFNPPLTLEPIGQCSKIPTANLYLESNTNKTFPYTNHTSNSSVQAKTKGSTSAAAVDFSVPARAVFGMGLAIVGAFLV